MSSPVRNNMPVHYSVEQYDRYTENAVEVYDDAMTRRLLQEQRLMRGKSPTVLDIGTGTAQLLVRMAHDPLLANFRLIGTDFFEDMVAQAQETVRRNNLTHRVSIERSDVHDLPNADNSVEFVISRSTIHHWANPVKAFQEIYRVLKPEGVAIIHEPRRDPNPDALAEFNRQRAAVEVEPSRMDEKYTADEVRQFLKDAGLASQSIVSAPRSGPGSMGFEVRLSKCHPLKVRVISWIAKFKIWRNSW